MSIQRTRTDIILNKIKNNKVFAILIVGSVVIGAFATFSESLHKIVLSINEFKESGQKISTFQSSKKYKVSDFENYFNSNFQIAEYENEVITISQGGLAVNFSILSNSKTFLYKINKKENIIRINPQNNYLSLLQKGGPVYPLSYWDTPFEFEFPNLDIKIVNNTNKTIFLTQAIFNIRRSKTDPFPILLIKGVGYEMKLPLRNIGWGKVYDCSIRCNIFPMKNIVEKNTYDYEIAIGEFEQYPETIDFAPMLKELGVDVEKLRSERFYAFKETYTQDIVEALGPFKDGQAKIIGEIHYSGLNSEGVKSKEKLKFEAIIDLGPRGAGAPRPPSFQYDIIFETDRSDYEKVLPISQDIKPGDADRFNIKISALRSSRHVFDLILLYNDNKAITIPNIALNYFMSTEDAKYIEKEQQRNVDPNLSY